LKGPFFPHEHFQESDGHVNAYACADSSKERLEPRYKKEHSASPMVATDSILISATIDAHKERDIATINFPGAFLKAYNNKDTIMLQKGCLAKLLVQVDPHLYCKYIIHSKKNQPLLYVKLTKAIYGLLKSALLFTESLLMTSSPTHPCLLSTHTTPALQMQLLATNK
jgi:hypothetical protein